MSADPAIASRRDHNPMPIGKASSETPPSDRHWNDATEAWAMPLVQLRGLRLSLSYMVFFAAAIVFAVVMTAARQPGNGDLTRAAGYGCAFWVGGWIAQLVTHLLVSRSLALHSGQLTIGLLGVEAVPRRWPAPGALVVSASSVGALLGLGMLFRWIEGGFQVPRLSSVAEGTWTLPGLGLTDRDSTWRAGAWLCWAQAILQMYPLPRSQGRQMVAALTAISSPRLDFAAQTAIFRRCLTAIALVTLVIALVLMSRDAETAVLKWPWFLLLGVLLWGSVRGRDISAYLQGFALPRSGHEPDSGGRARPRQATIASFRRVLESRRARSRAKRVLEQEHSEAMDVSRLDGILERLHRDGMEALDAEDKQILKRVSENLRRRREDDSVSGEAPD